MKRVLLAGLLAAVLGGPVSAQDLIGSYVAYIGRADLFNSNGQRLTAPWQVLRQDRANVHRFGISQPGDEGDPFFGDINNRANMERMMQHGFIDPGAAAAIMRGELMVFVRIYGRGGIGDHITVTVAR